MPKENTALTDIRDKVGRSRSRDGILFCKVGISFALVKGKEREAVASECLKKIPR